MTLPEKCPPLVAENIGKMDDYGYRIDLRRVAAAVIDSAWHYSWHWDTDDSMSWNPISLKGWQTALKDGTSLLEGLEAHAASIRKVLPCIREEIARHEQRAAEEAAEEDI
jgi:hypothetical protein